jgi:endoglucanase
MARRGPRVSRAAWLAILAAACGGGGSASSPDAAGVADAGAGSSGMSEGGSAGALGMAVAVDSGNDFTAADAGPIVAPQPLSPFVVVDQFGYRTASEKIAVVRSPVTGFDATSSFMPGGTYALVDAHSSQKLLEAAPMPWNGGAKDSSSGDKAWWFDFSSVTTPGDYFVLDETKNVRSPVLRISDDVYRDVLTQSVRMLYYQRDGIAKELA